MNFQRIGDKNKATEIPPEKKTKPGLDVILYKPLKLYVLYLKVFRALVFYLYVAACQKQRI